MQGVPPSLFHFLSFLHFPSSSLFFIIFGTSPSTNCSTSIWISYIFLSKKFYFEKTKSLSSFCIFLFIFSFSSFCLVLPKSLTSPSISHFLSHSAGSAFHYLTTNSLHLICRSFFRPSPGQTFYLNPFSFSPVERPVFHILPFLLFSFPTTRWKRNSQEQISGCVSSGLRATWQPTSPYESRNSRTFVVASPFLSVLLRATEMQNGFVESLEPHPLLVAAWKLSEMGLGHTEIKTGAARHEVQGTTKSLHEEMELCVKLRDNQTQGKTGHISRWQLL